MLKIMTSLQFYKSVLRDSIKIFSFKIDLSLEKNAYVYFHSSQEDYVKKVYENTLSG